MRAAGLALALLLVAAPAVAQEVGVSTEDAPAADPPPEAPADAPPESAAPPPEGPADDEAPPQGDAAEDELGVAATADDGDDAPSTTEPAEEDAPRGDPPPPLSPAPNPFGDAAASRTAPPAERVADRPSPGGSTEAREEGAEPSIPARPVPDYDGLPEGGLTVEEGLLWVPRVLFFPVHLLFEYVLRQPIGWFLTTMERERWHVLFIDFFTWNGRQAGLVPTALFDFGFVPSVGLYFFWNDFLADGNDLRAQIGFGGPDFLRATLTDRVRMTEETELGVTVDALRRPDQLYEGTGWNSSIARRSRFFQNYVDGRVDFRLRPWRTSEIRFAVGVRWNDYGLDGYSADFDDVDPRLGEAIDQGFYPAPDGIEGYTAYYQRLEVAIDTRAPRPEPGHGLRLEGYVHQGFDVTSVFERRWMRYGGAIGGFLDLGENRVLALHANAELADPLGTSQPVPFRELVELGGRSLVMSGFLNGQLLGRSAAAVTLEYRYPIWVFLDGSLHASIGNVFGERYVDFAFDRLRASFGFGLRSIGDRDQSFNMLLAFGTSPFVEGAGVESVRLVIGSQQGF